MNRIIRAMWEEDSKLILQKEIVLPILKLDT